MPTKSEISDELNDRLNTDIEWEQLKKDDLEQIQYMIESGKMVERILKTIASDKGKKAVEAGVENWKPGMLIKRLI